MSSDEIYRQIQSAARADGAKHGKPVATQEYLTRHALESLLDRLVHSGHSKDFVLKGGILLGVYGVRRPTKDIDTNTISADLTPDYLSDVIRDVAAVEADDGVTFFLNNLKVQEIREGADYPGIRVRVPVSIGTWRGVVAWDVSTGDPVVPAPRQVTIDRLVGDPIKLIGYAAESTVAEKGVTILERGITSTRWRDYFDIVALAQAGLDEENLIAAVIAVAEYRKVLLQPTAPILNDYGKVGQSKWAAWRRKERLEAICEENLDDQIARVSAVLDPVFLSAASRTTPNNDT